MFQKNQLLFLQKFPQDVYGYYNQNGERLMFYTIEEALEFEKNMLINIFRFFR